MSCCCNCDEPEEPVLHVKPNKERSCTDVSFILLFIAYWGVIIAIWIAAIVKGANPWYLRGATDYQGRICGHSSGVENQSLAAWPIPTYLDIRQCTSSCNITQTYTPSYESDPLLQYCFNGAIIDNNFLETPSKDASRAMGDLFTTWPYLVAAPFLAVIFSLFYIYSSKVVGRCFVYLILTIIIAGGFLFGFALLYGASHAEEYEGLQNRKVAMRVVGAVVIGITGILLLIIWALRKRIEIAIEVIAEAGRALRDIPQLMLWPLLPFLCGLIYIAFWIVVTVFIFSVKTPEDRPMPAAFANIFPGQTYYVYYQWNEQWKKLFVIHLFHLFWNVQFWFFFLYFIISGTIADWYFTADRNKKKHASGEDGFSVTESCHRTCRFHLGTILFGALIIATLEFIKMIVKYLDHLATTKQGGQPNILQKLLKGCIYCCLQCATCCMNYVSKNAFVWTAIYGQSFLPACCNSWSLLFSNILRVGAINIIGDSLLWIGKIIVAFLSAGILLVAMDRTYELSSLIMPALIMFVTCYLVAGLFMALFETAIDTIFLCFLVDEKHNKATGYMLASPELIALVDKHGKTQQYHDDDATSGVVRVHSPPLNTQGGKKGGFESSTQTTSAPGGYL